MDTLLLAQDTWDLVLDIGGNIAVASDPYAQAQDVASAVKVFFGEVWYDTEQGVKYLQDIMGKSVNLELIKSQVEKAALTVPGIVSARAVFVSIVDRKLRGQVQITNSAGVQNTVNF